MADEPKTEDPNAPKAPADPGAEAVKAARENPQVVPGGIHVPSNMYGAKAVAREAREKAAKEGKPLEEGTIVGAPTEGGENPTPSAPESAAKASSKTSTAK